MEQVVALAVDAGLGVHAVIGDRDEGGLSSQRAGLDGGPDAPNKSVDALKRQALRSQVGSGVGDVIEVASEVVEVLDVGIGELSDELAFGLVFHHAANFKANGPLVEQLADR